MILFNNMQKKNEKKEEKGNQEGETARMQTVPRGSIELQGIPFQSNTNEKSITVNKCNDL